MKASGFNNEKIKTNFSDSVTYYDQYAHLQKKVAERLSDALEPWKDSIVEGPVIEVGAGTGFFSTYLLDMYKKRKIILSDISSEMIQFCRNKFGVQEHVEYRVMDAEQEEWRESTYALITANYVAQWFRHPPQTLSKMAAALKPGGLMLISFPARESFSAWRKYCLDLGLPYTGNSLPDLERVTVDLSMGPFKVDYYEDDMFETFDSVYDFFKHLKNSGTSTNISEKQLTPKQLKLLNEYWLNQTGGKIHVQFHTAFIAVKKDLDS